MISFIFSLSLELSQLPSHLSLACFCVSVVAECSSAFGVAVGLMCLYLLEFNEGTSEFTSGILWQM